MHEASFTHRSKLNMSSMQNFHNNSTTQLKKDIADANNWNSFNHISSEQCIQLPIFKNGVGKAPNHLIIDPSREPTNSNILTSETDAFSKQLSQIPRGP